MNFYDYYSPNETLENPFLLAAQSLVENGLHVIPIEKGTKKPSDRIKDIGKLRQRPLHSKNIDFFFDRDDVEIAIMMHKNMEVLDVDTKNLAGLSDKFLHALRHGWQELYDKLVISKTPSGGLHILYTSEIVGGEVSLARINASPHPLTIIERLNESNKNYIKCSPSIGYDFIQGNPIDLPYLDREERTWLCSLAASFNQLIIPEATKADAERPDSPWNVFNDENDWSYIFNEVKERGWEEMMDLPDKVVLKRPGSKQHSAYLWKDTNSLYVFSSSTEFEPEKGYSPFGVYCLYYHDGSIASACKSLAADGIGTNIFAEGRFWKKVKKSIKIKYTDLADWLKQVGYRTYQSQIVKVTDNIVSIIDDAKLKAAFLNEIEYEMQDYFYGIVGTIFSKGGGIMSTMSELEDSFINDDKNTIWLFFKNYAVKITSTDILPFQYKELKGYIWEGSIINRKFYNNEFSGCDAERFSEILGGSKYEDLRRLIGYSISRYKDPVNPKAVLLTEDIDPESEGESQGGSGKGLLFGFVRKFRKVCDFDGKSFNTKDSFVFQNVDPDTDILFIDDLERNFKFSSLFSILTGALPVNKKNEKQMLLPYEISPKIFLTSNYTIGAMDISTERRKYEFSVVKYFGDEKEPIDEFGREFFTGWDADEWVKFDNYIADCCRLFLATEDKKHIGNITKKGLERSLVNNTNRDFVEYMDSQLSYNFFDFCPDHLRNMRGKFNGVFVTNAVDYNAINKEADSYLIIEKVDLLEKIQTKGKLKNLTTTALTRWLKQWGKVREVEIDTSYKRGAASERCYRIVNFVPTLAHDESGNEKNNVGTTLEVGTDFEINSDFDDEFPF